MSRLEREVDGQGTIMTAHHDRPGLNDWSAGIRGEGQAERKMRNLGPGSSRNSQAHDISEGSGRQNSKGSVS
jgi:hypothetical protein